jgi:hypothetical protein
VSARIVRSTAVVRRGRSLLLATLLVALPSATTLSAQTTPPITSLIGIVTDSLSGRFVSGAEVTVGGTQLTATTDLQGRFTVRNVPVGARRVVIVRPGYADLEAVIQITDPMGGVLLKLQPDLRTAPDSVDIAGTVTDAASGAAIVGADVTFGDGGPRTTTNPEGRFVVRNARSGTQTVVVRRFGYRDHQEQIEVRLGMRDPAIRLTPDPVQLEALTVTGDKIENVRGRVVDALSNQPVAYVNLTLTKDGIRRIGRAESSDSLGAFTIDDVKVGGYLLKVERLGYTPQYFGFSHPSPEGLQIRLAPSPAMLDALEVVAEKLEERTKSFGYSSWVCDEKSIRDSRARQLNDLDGWCAINLSSGTRRVGQTVIYVDELPGASSDIPSDYYQIEAYLCPDKGTESAPSLAPGASGRGGIPALPPPPTTAIRHVEYHFFTYEYIERLAGRPRALIPPCS